MAGRPLRRARMNAGKVATLHGVDMGDYPEAAAYYARREKEQQDFLHRRGESQIAAALRRGAQSEEKFRHRLHNTANFNYKKVLDSMLAEGKIERFERGGETFLRLRVPTFAEFQERRSFDPAMGRLNRARMNSRHGPSVAFDGAVGGKVAAAYPVVRVVSVNHPREGGYYDPDAPYSAQLEIRYPTARSGAIVYLNHQGDGLLRTRSGQIDIDENQDPALRAAAEVLDMGLSRGPGPGRGPRGW